MTTITYPVIEMRPRDFVECMKASHAVRGYPFMVTQMNGAWFIYPKRDERCGPVKRGRDGVFYFEVEA